jgi:hypothetical protein
VCGADCWHPATALRVSGAAVGRVTFLTEDAPQREVVVALGFAI